MNYNQIQPRSHLSAELLNKIATASASGGGNNILPGYYILEIHKLIIDPEKFSGTCFIVEHKVVKAAPAMEGVDPNQPGSMCSYVVNLSRNPMAMGNCKQYILALCGINESQMFDDYGRPLSGPDKNKEIADTIAHATSTEQPCMGMLIGDNTFQKIIKTGPNKDQPLTAHSWYNIPQTEQQVMQRRAIILAGDSSIPF